MEITAIQTQTVAAGQNVLFTETPVKGAPCIQHREGSGIVTLRGITNQNRARFRVSYSGNIAIPTGGTVQPISLAIAISGEPLLSTQMIVTPAAVGEFFNVSASAFVEVPKGCCVNIAVENTTGTVVGTTAEAIDVANSNLIVTREA